MPRRRPSRRVIVFSCVVLACVGSAVTYMGLAVADSRRSAPPPGVRVTMGASLASDSSGARILFVSMIPDKTVGKLAVASLSDPNSARAVTDLSCERVYYAGGRGLCLTRGGLLKSAYVAKICDADFHVLREVPLPGIPSRARVSPDGRYGATTMFVRGDSYASANFSTRTAIVDMNTGETVADLEKLPVTRDGTRFWRRNFNFWGVTFAGDDDHFYASLGSGTRTYLLVGSLRTRTLRVIHEHVECPSLSPDGTRIAFKRSIDTSGNWRLYVLDLRTMHETALAENDPIDDQAEWIDNENVAYGNDITAWQVPADGTGKPQKLLAQAYSPTVVRTP